MFYITVSNGLLKDGHRKKMGSAVWEFMWFIDKVTKIDNEGMGWVLGGKPVNLEELADGINVNTVSRNINKLHRLGYIKKIRTPYGLSIRVCKMKKRFNKNVESKRLYKNVESHTENVESNKTISVDNTTKTKEKQVSHFSPIEKKKVGYTKNMKRNSFKYSEQSHTDEFESVIDYDSGEEVNPKKNNRRKDQDVLDLQKAFIEICHEEIGIRPIKDVKGYMVIRNALKYIDYNEVIDMYERWFKQSGRPQEDLLAVTKCLSNNELNKYRLQKQQG